MTRECDAFITLVSEHRWSGDDSDFWRRLGSITDMRECLATGLQAAARDQDWALFQKLVIIAIRYPSAAAGETLCAVLDQRPDDEDVNSEDVVDALWAIPDPKWVPTLKRATEWDPDWDEYRQLARKCVWALGRIADEAAVQVLQRAAQEDPSEMVREAAAEELRRIAGAAQ